MNYNFRVAELPHSPPPLQGQQWAPEPGIDNTDLLTFSLNNLVKWNKWICAWNQIIKFTQRFIYDSIFVQNDYPDCPPGPAALACLPLSWWMGPCGGVVRSGGGVAGREGSLCDGTYDSLGRRDVLWYVLFQGEWFWQMGKHKKGLLI